MWAPAPSPAETVIEILLETNVQHLYRSHLILIHRLLEFLWKFHMGKEADLLFTVPVVTYFWPLEEHEPLIMSLPPPIISHSKWRGP